MKKYAAVLTIILVSLISGIIFTACIKDRINTSVSNAVADTSSALASASGNTAAVEPSDTTAVTAANAAGISSTSSSPDSKDTISCKYFNEKGFRSSVSRADNLKPSIQNLAGGIVPHHLLACDMIARFFKTVSASNPEVVVVIAPNHKRTGNAAISTGDWSWQTAFGKLDADAGLTGYLKSEMSAAESLGLLEEDHSISALVPYIKYYMPSAKIVPVMLHGNLGRKDSEKLGAEFARQLKGRKSIVVASVDFSHYLTPEKAESMDKTTLEAINSMDMQSISRMGNDNLDSPPSIMTLLSYMKSIGASNPEILEHGNSSTITGKWSSSTTSYFTITWKSSD